MSGIYKACRKEFTSQTTIIREIIWKVIENRKKIIPNPRKRPQCDSQ
jgi:hypothetical protein